MLIQKRGQGLAENSNYFVSELLESLKKKSNLQFYPNNLILEGKLSLSSTNGFNDFLGIESLVKLAVKDKLVDMGAGSNSLKNFYDQLESKEIQYSLKIRFSFWNQFCKTISDNLKKTKHSSGKDENFKVERTDLEEHANVFNKIDYSVIIFSFSI